MRSKSLLFCLAAVAALFVAVPTSANASGHPPVAAVCIGGESNGVYESMGINTPALPGLPLSLGFPSCLTLNPNGLASLLGNLGEQISGIEPADPPTPEQLQQLLETLQAIDYSSPLAALIVLNALCGPFPNVCDVTGLALNNLTLPLTSLRLEHDSGFCFTGEQSGSGTLEGVFNYSDRQQLDYTIDYNAGLGLIGLVSGSATNDQFGSDHQGEESNLSGLYLPGCGSGAKVALVVVH